MPPTQRRTHMVPIAQEGVSYVSTSVTMTAVMDENTSDADEGRP